MKTEQVITLDRRQRAREGVLAEIENITYNVLRRYGINGPTEHSPSSMVEKAA